MSYLKEAVLATISILRRIRNLLPLVGIVALPSAVLGQVNFVSGPAPVAMEVSTDHERSGSCPMPRLNGPTDATPFLDPLNPGSVTIPVSPFFQNNNRISCPILRVSNAAVAFNHPDGDFFAVLPSESAQPQTVAVSDAGGLLEARAVASATGRDTEGGDRHGFLAAAAVDVRAPREPRDSACIGSDGFSTSTPKSQSMLGIAVCTLTNLRTVPNSFQMQDGKVVSFQAEIISDAWFKADHGTGRVGSIRNGARYRVTLRSVYQFQPADDALEVITKMPDPLEALVSKSMQDFKVTARYTLLTKDQGTLRMRLENLTDFRVIDLGMTEKPVTRCDPNAPPQNCDVELEIPGIEIPDEGELLLVVELTDDGGNVLESVEIPYKLALDLSIDHTEVVQVVQTVNNTITLIANKSTVVRPFTKLVEGPEEKMTGVEVDVHAFRGGAEVANSPFRRQNVTRSITAKTPSRDNIFHAHNLRIPANWTQEGELTIRVVVDPLDKIDETDEDNNESEFTVRFVRGTPFTVRYMPVCIAVPGLNEFCPSNQIGNAASLLPKLFPVPDGGYSYAPLNVTQQKYDDLLNTPARQARFTSWINRLYQWAVGEFGRFDQLVAWVPRGFAGRTLLGYSDPTWLAGQGRVTVGFDNADRVVEKNNLILAHELSHNLGLRHPSTSDSCGSSDGSTDWPYAGHTINEYGYDPMAGRLHVPSIRWDLMAYCGLSELWISDFHYNKLIRGMLQPQPLTQDSERDSSSAEGEKSPAPVSQGGPVPVLMVSGMVDRDANSGAIEEVYQFDSSAPRRASNPDGNTCLRLSGTEGVISDYCFDLTFVSSEDAEPFSEQSFTVVTAFDPATTGVALLFNGQELASRSASAAAPSVEITSPSAGDTWDGATEATVTWTAADADGDPLLVTLLYSSDGAATWLPVAIDLEESSYTFSPALIEGGDMVWFRVVATDGFHSSEARVGPITLEQRPAIAAAADPVEIGKAVIGDEALGRVVLRNPGTGPLNIASVIADQIEFRVTFPIGPFVIQSGSEIAVEILYGPSAEEQQTANLLVASNATDQPQFSVRLNGEGVDGQTPILRLNSTATDFGAVEIGELREANVVGLNASLTDLELSWAVQGVGFGSVGPLSETTVASGEQFSIPLTFTGGEAGDATGSLTLTSNDPDQPTTQVILVARTLSPPDAAPEGPRINQGGVVDAASFQGVIARGAIGSIFGVELAASVEIASDVPLARELAGVKVEVDGHGAPLFFTSPTQINFQVPFEVAANGTSDVVVIRDDVRSAPVSARLADFAPGMFVNPANGEPIVTRHPEGALITSGNPAEPEDVLTLFLTGIGDVTNVPTTGAAAGVPLSAANVTPTVTIGGVRAQVLFAGLAPFFVALVLTCESKAFNCKMSVWQDRQR